MIDKIIIFSLLGVIALFILCCAIYLVTAALWVLSLPRHRELFLEWLEEKEKAPD